jgi:hypothetical protein
MMTLTHLILLALPRCHKLRDRERGGEGKEKTLASHKAEDTQSHYPATPLG